MADPFLGEIRLFAGSRVPSGWQPCDGQTVSATINDFLFLLLGNAFGGDSANFALPDLRGRVPVHLSAVPVQLSPVRPLGQSGGREQVLLGVEDLPSHTHTLRASTGDGDRASPVGNVWARSEALGFSADAPDAGMHAQSLATAGAGTPHENMMPFLGVSALVATAGLFPGPEEVPEPDFFIGEIRMMASGAVPGNWAPCDGQLLAIADYSPLFQLIGNVYGGDGVTMFALPDLRARVPLHRGPTSAFATAGGEPTHELSLAELPAHTHRAQAAAAPGDAPSPAGRAWGVQSAALAYAAEPDASLGPSAVAPEGAARPHENMPPFLALNFCIALGGRSPTFEATDPILGEIRMFAFEFAPVGWALCDGQVLPIAQNEFLFDRIGNAYGGNGTTTFALPDLQGRAPLHRGQGPGLTARMLGDSGGASAATLATTHLPAHTHEVRVRSGTGGSTTPLANVFGAAQARASSAGYASGAPSATTAMAETAVTSTGSGQAHNNMPPHLAVNFCIAEFGVVG